jgi:hypothetical protein
VHEYRNSFLRWFIVLFAFAYFIVYELQEAGTFDSLGLWYTIYCAVGFSLPIAAVLAFFRDTKNSTWWRLRR